MYLSVMVDLPKKDQRMKNGVRVEYKASLESCLDAIYTWKLVLECFDLFHVDVYMTKKKYCK